MNGRFRFCLAVGLGLLGTAAVVAAPPDPAPAARHVIARIWRGRTLAAKADDYERYLNDSGIAKLRTLPGNLGVTVLRRSDGDKTEFLVMSLWDSVDAIKKFAGEDYQKAVLLPRDREYLIEVEPNVFHYDVLSENRKP
jgi:heme-degrading monooxygenase HmoA